MLPNDISAFYKAHFDQLDRDKQFHFATRLSAWNNDSFSLAALSKRTDISRNGDLSVIKGDLRSLLTNPPVAKVNAAATRQLYFSAYPDLRGRMLALFRVRHLLVHYQIDARSALLELCPQDQLVNLTDAITDDNDAIKTLSTYAINYIYLVHHILFSDDRRTTDTAERSLQLGTTYNLQSPEQIQLLIYLYTHCIIGESNFYTQTVTRRRDIYWSMLQQLESIIQSSYDVINLDNKLEFLVCCRILKYSTNLFERIDDECRRSISPDGTFVIDTHNLYKQSNKTSFSDSEHRNVLYIMSANPIQVRSDVK